MSRRIPAPRASRPAVGVRARTTAKAPADLEDGRLVELNAEDAATVATVVRALPDPAELDPGTLVVVPAVIAEPRTLARSVLAVFGRTKTMPRTRICTALVARGYVDVGAADTEDGEHAWGRVPADRGDPT